MNRPLWNAGFYSILVRAGSFDFGQKMVDRSNRKFLMIISDLASGL
jgi:hypothetical protein